MSRTSIALASRSRIFLCAAALSAAAAGLGPAASDPAQAAEQAGRYTMTPTEGGFLRLDTKTGAVSLCKKQQSGWFCQSIAEDQTNTDKELDRLRAENQRLKEQSQLLPPEDGAEPPAAGKKPLELPSKEDVDKVMNFLEDVIRRFKHLVEEMPKEDEGTPL